MRKIIYVLIFIFLSIVAHSQDKGNKIEAAKVAFIKDKIQLTEQQETVFWSLYNDFLDKKQEIKKQIKNLKTETGTLSASDDILKYDLQKLYEIRANELAFEKEFYTLKLPKIISIRQIIELQKAEKQFTLMLIKKLEEGK